jgi:hypothetical protein
MKRQHADLLRVGWLFLVYLGQYPASEQTTETGKSD